VRLELVSGDGELSLLAFALADVLLRRRLRGVPIRIRKRRHGERESKSSKTDAERTTEHDILQDE